MNDINAACAGAHSAPAMQKSAMASVEERLNKLHALRESGMIDSDDFARRKREILDQV